MLRMIIVDDKQIVLEGLQKVIDWSRYGIQIIGACTNGIDAYDMILGEYPDIVFTDIKMPSMGGLELIKRSQEIDKNIKFVILSGYAEFDFAKQAMQCGVRHYLLKPYSEKQILDVVQQLVGEIAAQREKEGFELEQKLLLEKPGQNLTRKLFVDLITAESSAEEVLEMYRQVLGETEQRYCMCAFSPIKEEQLDGLMDCFLPILEPEKLPETPYFIYFHNVLITFLPEPFANRLEQQKGRIGESLEKAFPGLPPLHFASVSYQSVPVLMEEIIPQLKQFDRVTLIDEKRNKFNYSIHPFAGAGGYGAVEKGDVFFEGIFPEQAEKMVDEVFQAAFDVDIARLLAIKLLVRLSKNGQAQELEQAVKELFQVQSVSAVQQIALEYTRSLFSCAINRAACKEYVKDAIDYINENLDDPNLSLKWIAEKKLFLNVDYFSHQFVTQTGEKFSSYLNRARMSRAKQLISQMNTDNIYEVAAQVGCGHNPRYFSQVFKKWVGCTPSQYRENSKLAK